MVLSIQSKDRVCLHCINESIIVFSDKKEQSINYEKQTNVIKSFGKYLQQVRTTLFRRLYLKRKQLTCDCINAKVEIQLKARRFHLTSYWQKQL